MLSSASFSEIAFGEQLTSASTQTLTPSLFDDSVDTFYAPTVTPGAVTLTPELFDDSTDTFYAPTVSAGAVTLTPTLFDDSADTFYSPTVTVDGAEQTLTAELFDDSADTFYQHIISVEALPSTGSGGYVDYGSVHERQKLHRKTRIDEPVKEKRKELKKEVKPPQAKQDSDQAFYEFQKAQKKAEADYLSALETQEKTYRLEQERLTALKALFKQAEEQARLAKEEEQKSVDLKYRAMMDEIMEEMQILQDAEDLDVIRMIIAI